MVIEVHNEQDPDKRPSSLQQLQEMLDLEPQKLENINQNTMDGNIPQEKDGFLSRKVGYEIERRLVKAVQVRTLRKKREKKGHYHYYPFYEKSSNYNGFWGWLKHHLSGILIIKLFLYIYVGILGCIMFAQSKKQPETRVIIKISTHPCHPRNFD